MGMVWQEPIVEATDPAAYAQSEFYLSLARGQCGILIRLISCSIVSKIVVLLALK